MKVLAVALTAAAVVGVVQGGLTVVTEGGRIQGKAERSINGRTFHSFYSIPYARPPIGPFRFKDPVKPGTWQRLANATAMPKPCLQIPFILIGMGIRLKPDEIIGVENCLFLNVFTPEISSVPERRKLPVMVWFHGGGFFSGAAEEYLPHTILNEDVVLVVVQYRLGILGFLSTEDSVMPGNLGLKDQTMALEWVQKNIHLFGGDKTRVTIFGESAGGASAHYHMLTHKSKGLYSQVIMQSGTALSPWSMYNKHREEAEKLGLSVGCEDVHNSTALHACLQKIDAKELTAKLQDHFQWFVVPNVFVPRVDGDYLLDLPAKLVADKQYREVSVLAGVTRNEGAMLTRAMFGNRDLITKLKENFAVLGPLVVRSEDQKESISVAETVFKHYLGDITFDEDHMDQLTQLFSDLFFTVPYEEVTAHHAAHFPDRYTFRYQLDYKGEVSLSDSFTELGKEYVGHADELMYLFSGGTLLSHVLPKGLTNVEDKRMRDIILKMWVNFATSGHPTPDSSLGFKWEPSTADNLHYLSITSSPSMQPDNRKEIRDFFASLPLLNSKMLHPEKQQQQQQQRTKSEHINQEEL